MPSSVVANFKYHRTRSILRVFFVSGSVYDYFKVPEPVYHEMKQSGSKGTFLNLRIKRTYRYKKIKWRTISFRNTQCPRRAFCYLLPDLLAGSTVHINPGPCSRIKNGRQLCGASRRMPTKFRLPHYCYIFVGIGMLFFFPAVTVRKSADMYLPFQDFGYGAYPCNLNHPLALLVSHRR